MLRLQAGIKEVWTPSASCRVQADRFLQETRRVLSADGGIFFSVSFEQPHFRTKFLAGHAEAFETDPYKSFKGYSDRHVHDARCAMRDARCAMRDARYATFHRVDLVM